MANVELEVIDLSTEQSIGKFPLDICQVQTYEFDVGHYYLKATYLLTGEVQESDITIVEGANPPLDFTFSTPIQPIPYWAYYYAWWNSSGWAVNDAMPEKDTPEIGRYDSAIDVESIRQHIRWAKEGGITGFITTFADYWLDELDVLVQVAEEENFKLGIITEFAGVSLVERDRQLTLFFDRYGNRTPFKSWNGKTLIVLWASWELTGSEWDSILGKYRDKAILLCCENSVDAGTGYIAKMAYFDGNAPYSPTMVQVHPNRFLKMSQECDKQGKIFLCPIGPGANRVGSGTGTDVGRENGEFYKRSNAITRGFNPPSTAIAIVSWNEFYEITHIEPSVNYGHQYLDLTRQFTTPVVKPVQVGFPIWIIPVVLFGIGITYIITKK